MSSMRPLHKQNNIETISHRDIFLLSYEPSTRNPLETQLIGILLCQNKAYLMQAITIQIKHLMTNEQMLILKVNRTVPKELKKVVHTLHHHQYQFQQTLHLTWQGEVAKTKKSSSKVSV